MAIWKDLTQPESFAGEYDTAIAAPASIGRSQRSNGLSTQAAKSESIIGAGVVIEGKIQSDGDLRIAGTLKGDIRVNGKLTIEAGARIAGAVSADSIDLAGKVEGNVNASDHVKLLETGQLVGDLKGKTVTIAPGSSMRGKVDFGWDEPEVKIVEIESAHERIEAVG